MSEASKSSDARRRSWRRIAGAVAFAGFLAGTAAAESNGGMPAVDSEEFAGMAEEAMTVTCASACHGFDVIFGGPRRAPHEWDAAVEDMIGKGAMATEEQFFVIKRYLKWAMGTLWINRATAKDVVAVMAVPEDQAAAIIEYRDANGPFADVASVKAVPGVDAAAIDAQASAIQFN